ncbi:uncharacterized protein B0I36DRAFT_330013 [Microdochium trichocladiopsis]|uniref:BRCT domain-containing protein n=1 Tax=Microdochium trichocladiopsis TaxID=1682393 RepID=A0A9P8XZT5_9PEZI|nr:uncharacterized protein B0I36DRAFT_330013 [Microdochium trichocladiopsis]KAH7026162.1 hypothetical protein B0I36DRAFT_330013 [Microdochium trichocladiopsis]
MIERLTPEPALTRSSHGDSANLNHTGSGKKPITTVGLTKPVTTRSIAKPPTPTKAAEPVLSRTFDPWNSSATGHQRAENRLGGSTGWRNSRNSKLMTQYASRGTGGQRISDSVGAGSQDYDQESQQLVRPEARLRARHSVLSMLAKPGSMKVAEREFVASAAHRSVLPVAGTARSASSYASSPLLQSALRPVGSRDLRSQDVDMASPYPMTAEDRLAAARKAEDEESEARRADGSDRPGLFSGVVVYVNGNTHPHVSDHRLKQLLAEHGGRMSMHLGRRKVTHVILGRPTASSLFGGGGGGAGGGLAGGKLQREIQKVGGCAVKYVGVEWVLESIKAGKRLPEARFANLKVAPKSQQSVYGLCPKVVPAAPEKGLTNDDFEPPPSAQRPP